MSAWIAVSSGQLPTGFIQYVLLWDAVRGMAEIAWLEDGAWISPSGDDPTNITHWAPISGPNGESQIFPFEDEAEEVQP